MKTTPSHEAFERELLGSALTDRVPDGARERVATRLGLLGGAAAVAAVERNASAGAGALTKPALLGVAGVGVLGLVLWAALPRAAEPAAMEPAAMEPAAAMPGADVQSRVTPPAAVPRVPEVVAAPMIAEPPPELGAARSSEPTRPRAAMRSVRPENKPRSDGQRAASVSSSATPPLGEGLLEEVKQLDRAREDLAAQRSGLALAVLDDYERRFPAGQLALEASVLRASTLAANGRSADAQLLARRLLTRSDSARYRAELEPIAGHHGRAGDIEGVR